MAVPSQGSSTRRSYPSCATAVSLRKKRAAAENEELDVFAAEKYFSGAMDAGEAMRPPWKISSERELTFSTPIQSTPSAIFGSEVASSEIRQTLRPSLWSCFGISPFSSSSKDSDGETSRKMTRTAGTIMAEPDVDVFSESSSDLFELDTVSTSTNAFWATGGAPSEASADWSIVTAKELSAQEGRPRFAPAARRLPCRRNSGSVLLGCRGGKALNVAASVHRTPARSGPGTGAGSSSPADYMQSPASHLAAARRNSAPGPALSLRFSVRHLSSENV